MQENFKVDPNKTNPNNPGKDQAPVDPSNTSDVGQKVEQGVIDTKGGISQQSSEWEDKAERSIPEGNVREESIKQYLKKPSAEEIHFEDGNES